MPNFRNNSFHTCGNVDVAAICPPGQYISSGSLKYGRWKNNKCPGPGVNSSTPISFGVFNLPFKCLMGVQTCRLEKSRLNEYFGDPFPGVAKHVSIIVS